MTISRDCSRPGVDVRELVLNHASLTPAGEQELVGWLDDLAGGIRVLVGAGLTQKAVRMCRWPYQIRCFPVGSLRDAYLLLLKKGGRAHENGSYLLGLSTKAPLLSGVSSDVVDRFRGCEEKTLPSSDGEPLVVCALTDAISVGFPSEAVWERDRLKVAFLELLPDDTFEDAWEAVDNLTSVGHAHSIVGRHRHLLRLNCTNAGEMWRRRAELFPPLEFRSRCRVTPREAEPGAAIDTRQEADGPGRFGGRVAGCGWREAALDLPCE